MSRLLYIPRPVSFFYPVKYGYLYNWWAASNPATVKYGYLYNWYAATDNRGVTAAGFHVPTKNDVQILIAYLGGDSSVADKVRSQNPLFWNIPGSNTSNLGLVGSGRRIDEGLFDKIKKSFFMWTVTTTGEGDWNWVIGYSNISILGYSSIYSRFVGRSIRPIKYSTTLVHGETGTYVDPSGIIYPTICIGTQEWVACNIMTKHYRNGDAIPEVTDNTAWAALTTGARCSYDNAESNAGTTKKLSSSDDWVIPSNANFTTLVTYLGGESVAGGKLKETGTTYWNSPNTGATNESGFNGKGSGWRDESGNYELLKTQAIFHSTTIFSPTQMYGSILYDNLAAFGVGGYAILKSFGLSLRLLYVGSGTPSNYVGNDGKVYRIVQIGTQWWLADNLAETKYRDGSTIPVVTDSTAWAALTTGARCVYGNDESNM